MATLGDRNMFQIARDEVKKEIDQFILSLNNKKTELMTEINSLETEHNNARKQKHNDVLKLDTLKSQTEELGQNNLVDIQRNLLEEIQSGIDKLSLESRAPPDFEIKIEWGQFRESFRNLVRIPKVVQVITVHEESNDEESDNGSNDDDAYNSEAINWSIDDEPLTPPGERRRFYERNETFRESKSSHLERTFSPIPRSYFGDRESDACTGGFGQQRRDPPREYPRNSNYTPRGRRGGAFGGFDRGEPSERRSRRSRRYNNRNNRNNRNNFS